MTVEGFHTFYVFDEEGQVGVWGHNIDCEILIDTGVLVDIAPPTIAGDALRTFAHFDAKLAGRLPVILQQTFREFVVQAPQRLTAQRLTA